MQSRFVLARASVLFVGAFAALLSYEAWYWTYSRDRQVALGAGFFAVAAAMIYRVAAAYLGALAGRSFWSVSTGKLAASLTLGAGLLLGLWLASLILQVGQNLVRARFGAPVLPLEFIRRGASRHSFSRTRSSPE